MPEEDMFTQEEAVEFLQNSFKIKDVLKKLKTDPKSLVDEIAVQVLSRVSFQSIVMIATSPKERRRPTYEEIKARGKSGAMTTSQNVSKDRLTNSTFQALLL